MNAAPPSPPGPDAAEQAARRRYWTRRAFRSAACINLGWGIQLIGPVFLLGCFLSALAIIWLRLREEPTALVPPGWAAWMILAGFFAAWRKRACFTTAKTALSRLDEAERLFGRLISAASGVGDWPPVPRVAPRPLAWRPSRILPPLLTGLALWPAAMLIPLAQPVEETPFTVHEPGDWRVIDQTLEHLREETVVREEALDQFEKHLEALREMPREVWYRQTTLEASAFLRERLASASFELETSLARAEAILHMAASRETNLSPSQRSDLQELLRQALEALDSAALPLHEALLGELKNVDLTALPHVTAEELRDLAERLCEAGACVGQCAMLCAGEGDAPADGGSPARGPGLAPLTFADQLLPAPPPTMIGLVNPDMRRAALGDQIGVTEDRHEVDETGWAGPGQTARPVHEGGGGETVWRMPVAPREQDVLKQYFR